MKKDREELEKTIRYVIKQTKKDATKNRASLEEKLIQHNISRGKVFGIYGQGIPLIQLPDSELYLVTKYLYEITAFQILEIDKWFYDEEKRQYDTYQAEQVYAKDIIELHNVDQCSEDIFYCTKATIHEMAQIVGQGLLNYNKNNQRGSKLEKFGDEYQEAPNIMKHKVEGIIETLKNRKFTANTITINIRRMPNNTESFKHESKTRTLYIESNGETSFADLSDGAHRCQAFIKYSKIDPDSEAFTAIRILHYTEIDAQDCVEIDNRQTPINFDNIKSFKNDEYVLLTKDISKYGTLNNNALNGKIVTNSNEIKTKNKYVTIGTFADAIRENFKLDNRNVDNIKEFMIKFFNELIGLLRDKKYTDNSIAFKGNMFIGYITWVKLLINNEEWKSKLSNMVDSLDFTNDEFWHELGIDVVRLKSRNVKDIVRYFEKVGEDNV